MHKAPVIISIVSYFLVVGYHLAHYIAARPHLVGMLAAVVAVWIIAALNYWSGQHG
jgi:uncharacterized membrane protein